MFGALLTIETSIEKPYKFVYMYMSHDCVQPPLGCTYSQQLSNTARYHAWVQ